MLLKGNLEDSRLMALHHYFAWQNKKDQSSQEIPLTRLQTPLNPEGQANTVSRYPSRPTVICPD